MALPTEGKKNMPVTPKTLKFGKEKPMPLPTTKGLPKKGRSNMAMRNDAGNNSNVNKIYGPIAGSAKSTSYLGNLGKELKQFGSAYKKSLDASGDITPGANPRARAANAKYDAAMGQLLGAALQGRRYDKKGKQTKGKK